MARRPITFGTSTGHFWHVDGSLLARRRRRSAGHFWHVDGSLLACWRAVTILLFTIFQPAARPILLWWGFRQFSLFLTAFSGIWNFLSLSKLISKGIFDGSLLARQRSLLACRRVVTVLLCVLFSSPQLVHYYFEKDFATFSLLLPNKFEISLSFNTNLQRNLVLASLRSLLARRRVTFGTSTVTFGMSTGRYYFTIHYFPACNPSNTTLNRILPLFPFSLLLWKGIETFSLFR